MKVANCLSRLIFVSYLACGCGEGELQLQNLQPNTPARCCYDWTPDCYQVAGPHNKNHACKDCGPGGGNDPCYNECKRIPLGDNVHSSDPEGVMPGSQRCRDCCTAYEHQIDWHCDIPVTFDSQCIKDAFQTADCCGNSTCAFSTSACII